MKGMEDLVASGTKGYLHVQYGSVQDDSHVVLSPANPPLQSRSARKAAGSRSSETSVFFHFRLLFSSSTYEQSKVSDWMESGPWP